jgi:hypothetical protein
VYLQNDYLISHVSDVHYLFIYYEILSELTILALTAAALSHFTIVLLNILEKYCCVFMIFKINCIKILMNVIHQWCAILSQVY